MDMNKSQEKSQVTERDKCKGKTTNSTKSKKSRSDLRTKLKDLQDEQSIRKAMETADKEFEDWYYNQRAEENKRILRCRDAKVISKYRGEDRD